ncbi:glycosyltransferase family 4 protein [Fictibacillus barbaricus]|uniref:Undecaprenyl/decaprenyl-phosphate alpha-N-acetylglucosaminyl 1-phosphate transferase n=1 Tax=Fictibacillus barbaricus TaxID=182136 RepID=A0ABS2ZJ79_9BACL|nr:MraY family glycosyltransferase [Fictibacillus barbaricus]MBN3546755.1 undecaprenyl/decaprenyl-phosphate alpha-N-acetylglucosaminyl 1-phosphate transferase [Fictibacillus barbaricus]GGB43591.1 undecaprenyl-phosphate alpha-N-acetylglucosaminyl 1-phosphate transferase [Fictibacillus barbaricus]
MNLQLFITFIFCFLIALLITPFVSRLAKKIGAVDKPNKRKVHREAKPRLGGLAIYVAFIAGLLILPIDFHTKTYIFSSTAVIVITGVLDDIYELSAKQKLLGQFLSAFILIYGGFVIDYITIPYFGLVELQLMTIPLTLFWMIGLINAINLIDGLDGLAGGVSTIALSTILIMAIGKDQLLVIMLCVIVMGSTLGFLLFNFYPAKIFMGDTGSQLLGLLIAVISISGFFKSVTFLSLFVPIMILGVPFLDTAFAIIRRLVNKQKWSQPDKSHLHHRLLAVGFSHPKTVLLIYGISIFFSILAFAFSLSTLEESFFLFLLLLLTIELIAEFLGLMGQKKPLTHFIYGVLAPHKKKS